MSDRVLLRKAHQDGSFTIVRLVEDQQPAVAVRTRTKPAAAPTFDEIVADYRADQARKRRSVKPASQPAAPAQPARRKVSINRFSRHQVPGERVLGQAQQVAKGTAAPKPYQPDTSAIIGLRRAFGLAVSAEDVDRTRRAMVDDHRAAKARKDAASAKPEVIDGGTGGTVVHTPPSTGDRAAMTDWPAHYAQVWNAIHRRVNAAGRVPVTVSAAEIARELGLTVADVNNAIDGLWRSGQLQRYGRPGGPVRWATTQ